MSITVYRIEVQVTDPGTRERSWAPVRQSGRNSNPYTWPTYDEAFDAMRRLYADVVADGNVRVAAVQL